MIFSPLKCALCTTLRTQECQGRKINWKSKLLKWRHSFQLKVQIQQELEYSKFQNNRLSFWRNLYKIREWSCITWNGQLCPESWRLKVCSYQALTYIKKLAWNSVGTCWPSKQILSKPHSQHSGGGDRRIGRSRPSLVKKQASRIAWVTWDTASKKAYGGKGAKSRRGKGEGGGVRAEACLVWLRLQREVISIQDT